MNSQLFKDGDSELAISVHHDTVEILFNNNEGIFKTRTTKLVLLKLTWWIFVYWLKEGFGILAYLEDRRLRQKVLG